MQDRRKEIKNRIAKRRKSAEQRKDHHWSDLVNDELEGYNSPITYESPSPERDHPLFKKEFFYFKILAAGCLFLAVAIMFKHPSSKLDQARSYVTSTMNQDFQFASVSSWYENTFGQPIAFLPSTTKKEQAVETPSSDSAIPVSGKITEDFEVNGEGVMVETVKATQVEAINAGLVIFAGVKDDLGKTVVIQHTDKSESWYGYLQDIQVKLYDPIIKGQEIGQVTGSEDGSKGKFYLAIKKDEAFIDPKQVISFE